MALASPGLVARRRFCSPRTKARRRTIYVARYRAEGASDKDFPVCRSFRRNNMSNSAAKTHCYEFPRPAVTADIVIVTRERQPRVLLIQRKHDPFAGCWALPGGYLNEN